MGASLSRFGRLIKKPLQTQGSVDKLLESKPITAPKHASSLDAIERLRSETAEEFKKRDSKDDSFLNMMKDIKIESTDINIEKETFKKNQESKRKLPQARHPPGNIPTQVREGKISTQNLTELFQKQMNSPDR
ncbi:NADH dehydrogenase [ubiquinone] 1 alpha subcomplex assembly factor 4-like, partial [Actinia tenebrosa]|uniref:NADH dehydrogenase [ubiquinone] 1 alpha subcomplex assembly factor 4-like n=1 Tax=Actinia tenebrosa TaxID=6105 RepID=A0A6P8HLX3_ACTTE